jgi:hypothetical protein
VRCARLNHDLFLVPSPSGYPPQQYSSSQPPPSSSRRSTLPTTPAYDHASLSPHPPAPPPSSASTSYNPSFPVPAVSVRHPYTNPSEPPPPGPLPIVHRTATIPMSVHPNTVSSQPMPVHPNTVSSMPMPVHPNTASSMPYDMRSPNTMPSPSQPGTLGGPQSSAQGYSYRASTPVESPRVHLTIND